MNSVEISAGAVGGGELWTKSFNTDMVAPRDRHAFWKEAIFDAIANVDIDCSNPDIFSGRVRWRDLDLGGGQSAMLAQASALPQTARRGARQLARERESFLGVTFQRKGVATIRQAGQDNVIAPGDISLLDCAQPYTMAFEGAFDHFVLKIPSERLAPLLPAGGQWRGRVVRATTPLARILNAHIESTTATLGELESASRAALLDTTIGLIALAFTDELRKFAGDSRTVRRALVLRASQYIDRRLADPHLSAVSIAAALGVSASYLQHAFQSVRTTVGAEIRRRRLERCRDDLADPLRAGEQVGEIAMRWVFNDLPHFSRAFKAQFGLSPRAYRGVAAGRCGRR